MSTKTNKSADDVLQQDEVNTAAGANGEAETSESSPVKEVAFEDLPIEEQLKMLKAENKQLEKKVQENYNSYLCALADADNAHKNYIKERANLQRYRYEGLAKGLLPVMDDFERCVSSFNPDTENDEIMSIQNGVKLIFDKLIRVLETKGIEKVFVNKGDTFTTDLHDAVATIPATDEFPDNTVVDCTEAAYKLEDKVIRYAKVIIAKAPEA